MFSKAFPGTPRGPTIPFTLIQKVCHSSPSQQKHLCPSGLQVGDSGARRHCKATQARRPRNALGPLGRPPESKNKDGSLYARIPWLPPPTGGLGIGKRTQRFFFNACLRAGCQVVLCGKGVELRLHLLGRVKETSP